MNEAGKGDRYRPVSLRKYHKNYDRIFKTGLDKILEETKLDTRSTAEVSSDPEKS